MLSLRSYTAALLVLVTLHLLLSRTESAMSCCVGYSSRRLPCRRLKRYTIQPMTDTCDIEAVIFHTKRGRFICANPSQYWTMKRIKCLRKRAQARRMGISSRG